jgi:gamma-tubulin complex component 2
MLSFVQHMYGFAVNEVLEPNWRKLEKRVERCQTVDELLRDHVDFLDTCLKECMLTNAKLLRVRRGSFYNSDGEDGFVDAGGRNTQLHSKLMTACTLFASYTSHFTKSTSQAMAALEKAGGDWTQVKLDKQIEFLERFEHNFNHHSNVSSRCFPFFKFFFFFLFVVFSDD